MSVVELAGRYAVRFIGDDQLPPEQDWAFLECDGVTYFTIKQSRLTERVLEDAWAAYRRQMAMAPPGRLRAG